MKKSYFTFAAALLFAFSATAQNLKYCGTDDAVKKLKEQHPEISIYEKQLEEETRNFSEPEAMPPIYTIPMVFHIIHDFGVENISDAQIIDAVRILNEDFRKLNADTTAIVASFQSIAADCEIEFALAKLDPSGNCTNGIDRIASPETYIGDDGSKLNQWPRDKYLNVWVVNTISSGAAGYSYYPSATTGSNAFKDGVMILHDYVGSIGTGSVNTSRALTHEIGHWANLQHTWGSTNNPGVACGDDLVSDTPITKGWLSCNLSGSVCNPPIIENVQNFMEYAYCSRMYTAQQKNRMRAALISSVAFRNNLWTSGNLTATGVGSPDVLCKSDFTATRKTMCVGDSTKFSDLCYNGNPTSWLWTFTGGTPAASIDSMPWITYNTAGAYDVSLTATNGTGSPSATKNDYIVVFPVTAQYNSSTYTEDFEGSPLPNTDWNISSNSGPAFVQNTSVGYYGSKCMYIDNFSATAGDADIAYSPVIDLTAITSPKLYFRVAYAQTNSIDDDILRVYCSVNCGQTWVKRYEKIGAALATTPYVFSSFTPANGSQWRLDSVSISPYATANDFIFKFEFHPAGGNNLYIDEINIFPPGMIGIHEEALQQYGFNVFPNPVENNSTVSFSLPEKQNVSVKLFDVLGQEVSTLANGELAAGEHKFSVNGKTMNSGIYFIRFASGEKSFAKKIVVN